LSEQIREFRRRDGRTQEDLANALGVTAQAVSRWEKGICYPDMEVMPSLANYFGVSIDELFGRAPLVSAAVPAETEQASQEKVIYNKLPWEDDRGILHAVLFAGHQLVGNSIFSRHNREKQKIEFCWEGPAVNVQSDFSVTCAEGTIIQGNVNAGDSVHCGAVCGSVTAGDGVTCGAVGGNVRAGDGVTCEVVGGNVQAGDSVRCGNVGGSVRAGDGVTCGDVQGDVHASDSIHCQNVFGYADAGDGVRFSGGARGQNR
jgi:transcriptional regulator with XRE-family HTH domain